MLPERKGEKKERETEEQRKYILIRPEVWYRSRVITVDVELTLMNRDESTGLLVLLPFKRFEY